MSIVAITITYKIFMNDFFFEYSKYYLLTIINDITSSIGKLYSSLFSNISTAIAVHINVHVCRKQWIVTCSTHTYKNYTY